MSCVHPMRVFYTGRRTENGAREVYFTTSRDDIIPFWQVQKKFPGIKVSECDTKTINGLTALYNYVDVPCGKCIGCHLNHAREWALRCCIEASFYKYNYFLTLTYDEEHLNDPILDKRDFQLFMKRLRKQYGDNIRFFACGEYGSKSLRKHWHAIIFNCNLDQKDFKNWDDSLYYSDSLNKLWQNGRVLIGPVNPATASYVARYCDKKKKNIGECLLMSRRPGIAFNYFRDHGDMFADKKIYFSDGKHTQHNIPGYFKYLSRLEDRDLQEFLSSQNKDIMEERRNLQAFIHKKDINEYMELQEERLQRFNQSRNKI